MNKRLTFHAGDGIGTYCEACKYNKNCFRNNIKNCCIAAIERLAELEDKIEDGELISKHYIIKDCGFYCVCEVDTTSFIVLNQYETEEEAQKALKGIKERRHADD